ncbi:MAG TPA: ribosomal protein S18-alanine N-acetyltransferase [Steroidobacteraceae bacterium]|nr:ribosomal protein S18-alanine N-acetyltransferase [Steroidobacteraceae bacterium]
MSSVKREVELPAVDIRAMHELDVPVIVAVERDAYQFPWSEGIFRDCLRVGYVCRVVDVGGDMAGYGIMSVGAGEAHILNVCIGAEYRCRGLGRKLLLYLLDRARAAGMYEAFLEVRPSNTTAARLYHSLGFEQVGVRRGYYQATVGREDAAVLRRMLLPDVKAELK